jgi:glutathione S-transferase
MGHMTEIPKAVEGRIKNAYGMLEAYLSETRYLAADNMTIADICAISTVSSLDGLVLVDGKRFV